MARNSADRDDSPDLGIPQEDPNVTIDLEEPEEGDGDPGDEQAAGADRDEPKGERVRDPKTGRWGDKKRARGEDRKGAQNWRTEKTQFETMVKTLREENARNTQAMQMRMDALMRQPAPAAQQQSANPFTTQMTDLEAQLDSELKLIEADPKRDYKRYNELRRQEQRLVIREENWRAQQGQKPQPQQQTRNPYDARTPMIESEFPWTMDPNNAELNKKAWAYRTYLISAEGRLDTIDTDREALMWAAQKFGAQYGIRQAPAAPAQRTRDMYGGPGQRGAPRRGDGRATEIQLPRAMLNGSGLSASQIAQAVREAESGE